MINKSNVRYILPLLSWMIIKIRLIDCAEAKKKKSNDLKQEMGQKPVVLKCKRGEIWEAYLGYNIGSEQNGVSQRFTRPVLIVQADKNNVKSPNTIIIPLSKLDNRKEEQKEIRLRLTEVLLSQNDVEDGKEKLLHSSILLCQNLREISKERLLFKITHINSSRWEDINKAIKYVLSLE